jgi:PleD family two-component response regulator
MTASLGVCSLVGGSTAVADDLLHQADDALYAAKNAGRNRVHAA